MNTVNVFDGRGTTSITNSPPLAPSPGSHCVPLGTEALLPLGPKPKPSTNNDPLSGENVWLSKGAVENPVPPPDASVSVGLKLALLRGKSLN